MARNAVVDEGVHHRTRGACAPRFAPRVHSTLFDASALKEASGGIHSFRVISGSGSIYPVGLALQRGLDDWEIVPTHLIEPVPDFLTV